MTDEKKKICPLMRVNGAYYRDCTETCAWYSKSAELCVITLIPTTIAAAAAFLGERLNENARDGG